jgi:uncharacterized membrane protein (UPF0127 family)
VYAAGVARTLRLVHEPTGEVLGDRIAVADSFWSRFRGLMLRRKLEPGQGLLIEPCASIHMLFMRFPIDAVFLDSEGRVVKIAAGVRPWLGIASARGARAVVELPAGAATRLQPGDVVRKEPTT